MLTKNSIALFFLVFAAFCISAAEVTVSASGQGPLAAAREQALTTALHDAVRQGAGVEIASVSRTKDLTLQEDIIFSRCMGYIESYQVTAQDYNTASQIYSVTIKAKVSEKPLTTDNNLAVAMVLKRLRAPVAVIRAEEHIEGTSLKKTLSDAILTDLAAKMGIQILDEKTALIRRKSDTARATFDTSDKNAAQKIALVSENPYDFIITSEVTGEISDLYTTNGLQVRDGSFDIVLKAVWADTAETLAVLPIQNVKFDGRSSANFMLPYRMPRQLFSAYLQKILLNKGGIYPEANAEIFYRRLLRKWIIELDLGINTKIRVLRADKSLIDKLIAGLNRIAGISHVRLRNFDSKFYSVIEVESKIDYRLLCNKILECARGSITLDAATPRRLTFETKK